MSKSGLIWQVWNFMTWTQPDLLLKKLDQIGLDWVGFGGLAGWLHTPIHAYRGDEQTNQATHECLGQKSKFSYLRGGQTNQASHKCLGKKSKSSYLLGRWTNQATHEYHGIKF